MELNRMLTIWDVGTRTVDVETVLKGVGKSSIRLREGVYGTLLTVVTERLQLHEVPIRFNELKRATQNSMCRSLKVFLAGSVPDLSEKGLVQDGSTWYLPHKDIGIGAVPYGKDEWCFLIEKRKGSGVTDRALQYLPQLEYQLKLEVV